MRYRLATSDILTRCLLETHPVFWTWRGDGFTYSSPPMTFAEAQKQRDALIRKDPALARIRVEYASPA